MKKLLLTLVVGMAAYGAYAQMPGAPFGFGGNQQSQSQAEYSQKLEDINYVGDGQGYHNMDVYLPKNDAERHPVVVHIYGSAWFSNSSKGMADINTICAAYLKAGYAVVTPNHRSSMDAKYPAQINDIKAVVRYLRAHADELHLDPAFIGVSGFSSGAHLASLMATTNGVKWGRCGEVTMDIEGTLGDCTQYSSRVDACCEWSGPVDLLNMDCDGVAKDPQSPEVMVMGMPKEGNEEAYALLNAVHYVDAQDVPIGIFHGMKDNVVPVCQGERFADLLKVAGVPSFVVTVPEGGHGFNMYSEENLQRMVDWMEHARMGKTLRDGK